MNDILMLVTWIAIISMTLYFVIWPLFIFVLKAVFAFIGYVIDEVLS
jgi:hypothetical protein